MVNVYLHSEGQKRTPPGNALFAGFRFLPKREGKRVERSSAACSHSLCTRRAGLILFYVSFGSEVETREMILKSQALGKRIALPRSWRTQET